MNENLVSQKRSTCWGTPSESAASEMLRKASGPFAKVGLLVEGAVPPRLHHLRSPEGDHPTGVDRGRLAGLGIAAHPLALGADLEHSEPGELHGLPLLERFDHQIERPL